MFDSENRAAIESVRNWVEKVIIGLNFCPFARREVVNNKVRYCVVNLDESKFFEALSILKEEFELLDQNPNIETTLILFQSMLSDFESFLDFLIFAEKELLTLGYEGTYQLAHFHPDYCFEGVDFEDPANFTNRAPFPVLHIIREEGLERVLKHVEDPEAIPETNIEVARRMGNKQLKALLESCIVSD